MTRRCFAGGRFIRLLQSLGVMMLLLGIVGLAAGAKPVAPVTRESSPSHYGTLAKILQESAQELEKSLSPLKTRLTQEKDAQASIQKVTEELHAAASTIKATLAVNKLPVTEAEELYNEYADQQGKLTARLKELNREIETIKQQQAEEQISLTELKAHVNRLQKLGLPAEYREPILENYQRYQEMATAKLDIYNQLLQARQSLAQELDRQQALLQDLTISLKTYIDKIWKTRLLKRRGIAYLWEDIKEFATESFTLPQKFQDWVQTQTETGALQKRLEARFAPILGLLFFLVILLYGTRCLKTSLRRLAQQVADRAVTFTQKTFLALGLVIARNSTLLGFTLWLGVGLWILDLFQSIPARIIFSALVTLTLIRLTAHLTLAIFEPRKPRLRIIPVADSTARFYDRYGKLFLTYLLAGQWGLVILRLLQYPADTRHIFGYLYEIGVLLGFAWLLRKPHLEILVSGMSFSAQSWRGTFIKALRPLVVLVLGAIIVSDLLGFHNLSSYMSGAAALTVILAFVFWVLAQMADDLNNHLTHPTEGLLVKRFPSWALTMENAHSRVKKIVPGIIAVLALLSILAAWGAGLFVYEKIFSWLTQGPTIGPVHLTPLAVMLAVAAIYLARGLSRLARLLLEKRLYIRTDWDMGIQTTISATTHYMLMALGIVLALGFLGFNLTNIALLAGALGIGIGFGLQNIVNNFVSGLILLFERPIKVGDMLIVDGQWGLVKEIRVRSTVFMTFDRYVLIIPNSELISSKVLNWTLYGKGPNRLTLKVGVSYGSDVHKVTQIIDQVCRANERVLLDPPPQIFFSAYGDSALDFTIWVHLRIPDDRIPATHELNCAIFDAFRQHGIEIPFPQRDLHFKTIPELAYIPFIDHRAPAELGSPKPED